MQFIFAFAKHALCGLASWPTWTALIFTQRESGYSVDIDTVSLEAQLQSRWFRCTVHSPSRRHTDGQLSTGHKVWRQQECACSIAALLQSARPPRKVVLPHSAVVLLACPFCRLNLESCRCKHVNGQLVIAVKKRLEWPVLARESADLQTAKLRTCTREGMQVLMTCTNHSRLGQASSTAMFGASRTVLHKGVCESTRAQYPVGDRLCCRLLQT